MPSLSSVQHLSRLKTECSIKTLAAHFHEGRAHVPTVGEKIETDDSPLKPVRTPVAILGSLGVCIYVPASRHWLTSYSPIHLT